MSLRPSFVAASFEIKLLAALLMKTLWWNLHFFFLHNYMSHYTAVLRHLFYHPHLPNPPPPLRCLPFETEALQNTPRLWSPTSMLIECINLRVWFRKHRRVHFVAKRNYRETCAKNTMPLEWKMFFNASTPMTSLIWVRREN